MREIKADGKILARHITQEDIKKGLNFYSNDTEFIQAGVWGHYEKGKELQAHIHHEFERTCSRTYEVLYIISGSIEASIYDLDEKLVKKLDMKQGEMLILLACGHGYRITMDDTTVLEVKNGPYAGADRDRYRF